MITGASSGIGMAAARELASAGMKLVLTGRRQDALDALAAELGDAHVVVGEITDPALPQRLVGEAVSRFGRCDVVFNNAGVMIAEPVMQLDIDAACEMVRINVEAAYRMALVAMRHFLTQKRGHLVSTSSSLGVKVRPTTGAYAGTKFAIEALHEDLRMQAAGTGVRVGVIEPGLTETQLQRHMKVHPKDALGIKRMATPADVARALRFMLEQPDHVTIPRLLIQPSEQSM